MAASKTRSSTFVILASFWTTLTHDEIRCQAKGQVRPLSRAFLANIRWSTCIYLAMLTSLEICTTPFVCRNLVICIDGTSSQSGPHVEFFSCIVVVIMILTKPRIRMSSSYIADFRRMSSNWLIMTVGLGVCMPLRRGNYGKPWKRFYIDNKIGFTIVWRGEDSRFKISSTDIVWIATSRKPSLMHIVGWLKTINQIIEFFCLVGANLIAWKLPATLTQSK